MAPYMANRDSSGAARETWRNFCRTSVGTNNRPSYEPTRPPGRYAAKEQSFFPAVAFSGYPDYDRAGHSQAIGLLRRSLSGRFDALRRTAPAAFPADRATQLEIMARGGPACAMHDGPAAGTRLSDLRSDCGRDSQRRHVENRRLFRKAGDPAERTDRFRSHPQGSARELGNFPDENGIVADQHDLQPSRQTYS